MYNYKKIKKEIEKIRTEKFDYEIKEILPGIELIISPLLRKVLLLYNDINYSYKDGEKIELLEILDEIMKNKFLEINPNLNDIVLNQFLAVLKRNSCIYPLDFYVISNAVIFKEMILDDDNPSFIRTSMLSNNGKYFNVLDNIYFTLQPCFGSDEEEKKYLEEEKKILSFVVENINNLLNFLYKDIRINQSFKFDKPHLELNKNAENLNIYLNKCLYELIFGLILNQELDIELIIQNGDNITLYKIVQKKCMNELNWIILNSNNDVWTLSKSTIEYEKESKEENDSKAKLRKLNKY